MSVRKVPWLNESVSAILWLENNVFLEAHTPSLSDTDMPPATSYTIVTRKSSEFMFQKLPEVCAPYGLNRSPPFQFMQRLKDFPPSIQDLIIVASTASEDVGIFTRSTSPLTNDFEVEKVTNVFTTTTILTESRRAALPMTEDLTSNTSPIGMALDLSSEDRVFNPLPNEDIEESPTPLPALMVLNNDGLLAGWWIMYTDSIKQGTVYPKLTAIIKESEMHTQQPSHLSPFASAQSNPLGSNQNTPGGPSSTGNLGAFGSQSNLGIQSSPWSSNGNDIQLGGSGSNQPTSGTPTFGSSTSLGKASGNTFGMTGGLGNQPSPWAASSTGATNNAGSVFGQPGGFGMRIGSSFGNAAPTSAFSTDSQSTSNVPASGGGFAAFAAKPGGFISAPTAGGSVFGKASQDPPLSSTMQTSSIFGQTPQKSNSNSNSPFGAASGFSLSSTFKRDESAIDDTLGPSITGTKSLFGKDFGSTLGAAQEEPTTPQSREADMLSNASDEHDLSSAHSPPDQQETTTPADTPAASKFLSTTPTVGGLFGTQAQSNTALAAIESSEPASINAEAPLVASSPERSKSPVIKTEPSDDRNSVNEKLPEAPLPPDSRSKTSYTPSDSSTSSAAPSKSSLDDAPLPPDFLPSKSVKKTVKEVPLEEPALPPDDIDENLDDEGSGVDVAEEFSPSSGHQSPKVTPESSFGAGAERSPLGGVFTKIIRQQSHQIPKPLFGELGKTSAPYLPPPSKIQESPRSPSPIRASMLGDPFRPDNARSVSAPGITSKPLGQRSAVSGRFPPTIVPVKPQSSVEERQNMERERLVAERARQQAEEEQDLTDGEDERVREELAMGIRATLTLDPFLAHQDYGGKVDKSGIPGQIERVYRDINSMIDTLGLNMRSLKSFTKGHCELYKESGRTREDLQSDDGWCLTEIEDLAVVERTLENELEQSRLQEVQDKTNQCLDLQRELSKLHSKYNDIKRLVDAKTNPDLIEAIRFAPLSTEQSHAQHDLRRDFTSFQKLLADAEEGIIMLRAKLASCQGIEGAKKNLGGPQKAPTVEAVTNTIMKMTNMVAQKSGDIDVLENQMRKLKIFKKDQGSSRESSRSRDGSPFVTPPNSARRKVGASVNGFSTTPRGEVRGVFAGSVGSTNRTPARTKTIEQVQPKDGKRLAEKAKRRRKVNELLKAALVEGGVRVRGLEEI